MEWRKKLEEKTKGQELKVLTLIEAVSEVMCDDYCKYTGDDEHDPHCNDCPLDLLY